MNSKTEETQNAQPTGVESSALLGEIWIVTSEYNEYDQYGAYFEAAYDHKPSFQELKLLTEEDDATVRRLTRGGGRTGKLEDKWWNLSKVHSGEKFQCT